MDKLTGDSGNGFDRRLSFVSPFNGKLAAAPFGILQDHPPETDIGAAIHLRPSAFRGHLPENLARVSVAASPVLV